MDGNYEAVGSRVVTMSWSSSRCGASGRPGALADSGYNNGVVSVAWWR